MERTDLHHMPLPLSEDVNLVCTSLLGAGPLDNCRSMGTLAMQDDHLQLPFHRMCGALLFIPEYKVVWFLVKGGMDLDSDMSVTSIVVCHRMGEVLPSVEVR